MQFRPLAALLAAVAVRISCGLGADAGGAAANPKRVVGYLSSWGGLAVGDIPGRHLTHLIYAFANIRDGSVVPGDPSLDVETSFGDADSCGCCARGNYNQLRQIKRTYPHLKVLLSIGGASWSGTFAAISSANSSRAAFASSAVKIVEDYGFDGIDVDWEFPASQAESEWFTLLLRDVRAALDAAPNGRPYLLTMAAGADEDQVVLMNYAEKMPHLDFVNLMLYDMSRGFDISRHQSPLRSSTSDPYAWPRERYNVDHVVSLMKAEAGGGGSGSADGRKFVIGIPLYGYRTTVEAGADTTGPLPGLFKSQSCGRDCQTPVAYADIAGGALGPDFRRHFDPEAQVPYLYDPAIGGFVTYDDVESVTAKAAYVNDNRLGGVMFWALDMDTTDNSTSLVQTAFRKMDEVESSPISLNTWCSSATPFCNVRCPRFHNRPLYAYAQ